MMYQYSPFSYSSTMSTSSSFFAQLNTTFSGKTASDVILYVVAGATNGAMLTWLIERPETMWGHVLVAGVVAYALTKFVERTAARIMTSSTTSLYRIQPLHLLIAGLVNGAAYLGLVRMLPSARAFRILAGALSYYFFDFVAWLASLANMS